MEDDREGHKHPLKAGWKFILENILDESQNSSILGEDHQAIHEGFNQLNKNLQQLSQYRHHINCRLEHIKKEMEQKQLKASMAEGPERLLIEKELLKLEDEGYSLQLEMDELEKRLRQMRTNDHSQGSNFHNKIPKI